MLGFNRFILFTALLLLCTLAFHASFAQDADGDGYNAGIDCNDNDPAIHPDATDVAGSGVDANCDGLYLWYVDADNDGYGSALTISSSNTAPGSGESATGDDCDDDNDLINPAGNDEAGSGVDANCDGLYLWYVDADADGYGSSATVSSANSIEGVGESPFGNDCDDGDDTINPAGVDIAGSGIDANCDGLYLWYVDADNDGYGSTTTISSSSSTGGAGESDTSDDCDDGNASINPAGTDVAGSGIDANCDGNFLWFVDADTDGYGSSTTISSSNSTAGSGEAVVGSDCDDGNASINPAGIDVAGTGVDSNCDGNFLWFVDADADGYGSSTTISSSNSTAGAGESTTSDDCDDENSLLNPKTIWYNDSDGDTYGDPDKFIIQCLQPLNYVLDKSDCNDSDKTVYPGAPSTHEGIDNNCDGTIDASEDFIVGILPEEKSSWTFYPNPVKDLITINIIELHKINNVSIMNMLGQTELIQFNKNGETKMILNLGSFPSGLYIVNIQFNASELKKISIIKE